MWSDNGSWEDLMGGLESVRLIGRDAESAQLYDAMTLAAQGQPQVVLVVGDAGIGKTGLVGDLLPRARQLGFVTATGHCLDIEASMSFAPVIEAVRTLVDGDIGSDERPQARRMKALLDPSAPEPDLIRMLDDLRLTILEAAASRPLLMLIEDLHWADRSTQDLVSAVARTAQGRLLLALTVRSDELHRRHPFRTTLAELSRLDTAHRVDLGPLDRAEIGELVRTRTGAEGDPESVTTIHTRSEGNPLYAEELIAATPGAVPEHLADLLLARVARLSPESRDAVRTASVDGSRVDFETLASVRGLEAEHLEKLLREAVEEHVLRQRDDVLDFRHGLLREAVYDDLLPGERARTHAAFAGALQSRVDAAGGAPLAELSRLAFHWWRAHDPRHTLAASVRAGMRALHLGTAESVTHLERAVELWDRVDEPESVAGREKAELLLLLGRAHADNERIDLFEALAREAVTALRPDSDRLVASRVFATVARCQLPSDDGIDDDEALRLALEYAGTTPSPELANALGARSSYHHRQGHGREALAAAEQSAEVARQVGDSEREVEALHFCAIELDWLGRVDEAISSATAAVRVARQSGRIGCAMFEESNLAWFELVSGSGPEAYERSIASAEECRSSGLPALSVFASSQAFSWLLWQGRFDDAERLLRRSVDLSVEPRYYDAMLQELTVARGESSVIGAHLDQAPYFVRSGFHHSGDEDEVDQRVTGLLMLGRLDEACELAGAYLTFAEGGDSPVRHASAAYTAFRAADAAARDTHRELEAHAERALQWAQERATAGWTTSWYGIRLAMAEGYRRRTRHEPAAAALREAVEVAAPFGAFVALEPRLLLAEELLTHGERDEGKELLTAVWADAKDMGAGDHERRAFKLATRARVPLAGADTPTGPLARLTPREREVLDLLADGASNRAIGEALFITETTASVPVSHVSAKLGVANRGAAAALARRLG
jgi:DNA-binding CsgD family transcriptional regulator